jgi:peptidoglycan/xylan/chitin deacetylase (PgdA/CDA1 family)
MMMLGLCLESCHILSQTLIVKYKKMRKILRNFIINSFGIFRRIFSIHHGKRVVTFHDIDNKKLFFQKMKWLKDNYSIVSMEELLTRNNVKESQIAITFDDGFECWYKNAVPVLEELKIPAIFFVCSGIFIDKNPRDFLKNNLHRTKELNPLSLDQLKYISANPLFEIGGHTTNHADLGICTSKRDLDNEIMNDSCMISRWTGVAPRWFAYPYGKSNNINPKVVEYLKQTSYIAAFTIQPSFIKKDDDKFLLPRDSLNIYDNTRLWKNWLSGGYIRKTKRL